MIVNMEVNALQFGKIKLNSAQNSPLDAVISVYLSKQDNIDQLKASIAPKENYDAQMLRTKRGPALTHSPTSYKDLALYDTALSIAVLRYLHDLHYGRVNP